MNKKLKNIGVVIPGTATVSFTQYQLNSRSNPYLAFGL